MNRKAYMSILCAIFIQAMAACGGSGNSVPPPVETITVTSGSGQSAEINTQFMNVLVATVSTGGAPNAGVSVTFAAPGSGASGTFAGTGMTATVTTDANGKATSPPFTANATTGGPYTVTATASGVTTPASFTLTNTAGTVTSSNFSFYLSGLEAVNDGPNFYALAGAVTINSDGTVTGGVQDYNDAIGLTSPSGGDTITGGTLNITNSAAGIGTLTLITNNSSLGVGGTETLGIQYVNANHALVIQFDGSATSSGSMDLQTLPNPLSPPSGSFAFTLSGQGADTNSVVAGGVLTSDGGSVTTGMFDVDDNGDATLGTGITGGTFSLPNSFGRGTVSVTTSIDGLLPVTINYYTVGPKVIRLIDKDSSDSAIGSAYSQGAGSFTGTSLGASVFEVESNAWGGNFYVAAGQFTTSQPTDAEPTAHREGIILDSMFSGVADDDELGVVTASASPISGIYMIGTNGYGSMTIGAGDLGDVSALGIYMVDPTLNILDPNNTTSGLGGALVADLDTALNGAGVILPQSVTTAGSISGDYALGAQGFFEGDTGWEFDFVGEGSIPGDDGVLVATGIVSDPFDAFGGPVTDTSVGFTGTAAADEVNAGRYTMTPFALSILGGETFNMDVVIYEASGGQLLWMEEDAARLFGGTIQQANLPVPAVKKKAAAKAKPKQK